MSLEQNTQPDAHHEEIVHFQDRLVSLQQLVGELLLKNQLLRERLQNHEDSLTIRRTMN